MLTNLRGVLATRSAKAVSGVAIVAGVVAGYALPGYCAGTGVSAAFSSAQAGLIGYIGDGVTVIAAVLLAGLAVGLLVKYARKAVRAA